MRGTRCGAITWLKPDACWSRSGGGRVPQPDLVVWPETATGLSGQEDPVLDKLVRDLGSPTLIGARYQAPGGQPVNGVWAWDPVTGRGDHYTKQELVPFGEYIPLRSLARRLTPFADTTTDLRPGTIPGVLDIADTRVGVAICYEVAYDYVSREAVADGARLLVVPTNNAWYGPGEMSYQQLAMSRLRAVELGRSVVVSATSGVSAIVRPDGSLIASTRLYTSDTLFATVPLRDTTTVAQRLGAWPGRLLISAGLLALLLPSAAERLAAQRRNGAKC
jgi:apolipoprotein N-acyltransferase